jgi:hypothetical protein
MNDKVYVVAKEQGKEIRVVEVAYTHIEEWVRAFLNQGYEVEIRKELFKKSSADQQLREEYRSYYAVCDRLGKDPLTYEAYSRLEAHIRHSLLRNRIEQNPQDGINSTHIKNIGDTNTTGKKREG